MRTRRSWLSFSLRRVKIEWPRIFPSYTVRVTHQSSRSRSVLTPRFNSFLDGQHVETGRRASSTYPTEFARVVAAFREYECLLNRRGVPFFSYVLYTCSEIWPTFWPRANANVTPSILLTYIKCTIHFRRRLSLGVAVYANSGSEILARNLHYSWYTATLYNPQSSSLSHQSD